MSTAEIRILSSALELKRFNISKLSEHSDVEREIVFIVISQYQDSFGLLHMEDGGVDWVLRESEAALLQQKINDLLPPQLRITDTEEASLATRVKFLAAAAGNRLARLRKSERANGKEIYTSDRLDPPEELAYILSDLQLIQELAELAKQKSIDVSQAALRAAFATARSAAGIAEEQVLLTESPGELSFTKWHSLHLSLFSLLSNYNKIISIMLVPSLKSSGFLAEYKKCAPHDPLFFVFRKLDDLSRRVMDRLWRLLSTILSRSEPKLVTNITFAALPSEKFKSGLCLAQDIHGKYFDFRLIHPDLMRVKRRADGFFRVGEEKSDIVAFRLALDSYNLLLERSRERDYSAFATAVQSQIANTMLRIGMHANSMHMLQDARFNFKQTLSAITKEKSPRNWVVAMNNLGSAELALGTQEKNGDLLKSAMLIFKQALEVSERRGFFIEFIIRCNITTTYVSLYEYSKKSENLEEASHSIEIAAQKAPRNLDTLEWAVICANKGAVRLKHYLNKKDAAEFHKGLADIGKAYLFFQVGEKYAGISESIKVMLQSQIDQRERDRLLLPLPETLAMLPSQHRGANAEASSD